MNQISTDSDTFVSKSRCPSLDGGQPYMHTCFSLFKDCGDAVVVADNNSHIVFWNEKAKYLFGENLSILIAENPNSSQRLLQIELKTKSKHPEFPLKNAASGDSICDRLFILESLNDAVGDIWLSITGFPVNVEGSGFKGGMLIVRDVTEREALRHQQSLTRDDLTGLVNRTVLMGRIEHALQKVQQDKQSLVALLCIDIKRLGSVNDTLGYIAGDQLLAEFASRLSQLRSRDTVSRLGGDEFTVLLEGVSSFEVACAIAEDIYVHMAQSFHILGHDIQIDASIGIALEDGNSQDAGLLLKKANLALEQARKVFGKKYYVFDDYIEVDVDGSLHLEMALRKAVKCDNLYLEYQPIFEVRTQKIIGFESLVRWHHPEKGRLSPAEFIPLAEETGIIVPMGWWVLEESCKQMKIWQDEIPQISSFFVSVNMSSKQFSQNDVAEKIKQILDKFCLHPENLKIEITEGVLIEHSSSIIEKLEAIRALGIKLSIDDFGTGYSSLSYLHRFPFDTLKIDRSFLENADSDYEKLEILQSVVRLAWNLGLEVVAEGIETSKHYAQIKALRCESGQGYLFSRPLAADAMERLIRQQTQTE